MATASVKNLATGGTSGVLYTDRRDFYISPQDFKELYPDHTPFVTLLQNRRQRTGLADPVFKMFQHQNPWERQYMRNNGSSVTIPAASSGAAAESNAVTIDGITGLNSDINSSYVGLIFEVWDSTRSTYKGSVILTDDASTTTAKFKNLGGTAISTVDNDYFVCVSNAQEEGTESPDAWADELDVVWNQCQIFKTPVEITGTLYEASLRGANNELARLRLQKMQNHKMHLEKALLFGRSPLGTNLASGDTFTDLDALTGDNSKVVRTTYGALSAVRDFGTSSGDYQSNFDITESTYKYSNFVDDMEKAFQYVPNSGEKFAFAGPGIMSFWSKLEYARSAKDNWTVQISDTRKNDMGFNIRKLETPHGVLNLVKTHALKYEYNKHMLVVDDSNLELVTYRPDKFQANIKTDNAYDGVKDQYFSDKGVGVTNIKSHQLFKLV